MHEKFKQNPLKSDCFLSKTEQKTITNCSCHTVLPLNYYYTESLSRYRKINSVLQKKNPKLN